MNNSGFSTLPDSIGNMQGLHELYLQNNKLTDLPEGFARLRKIQKIFLEGNPMRLSYQDIKKMTPSAYHISLSPVDVDNAGAAGAATTETSKAPGRMGGDHIYD